MGVGVLPGARSLAYRRERIGPCAAARSMIAAIRHPSASVYVESRMQCMQRSSGHLRNVRHTPGPCYLLHMQRHVHYSLPLQSLRTDQTGIARSHRRVCTLQHTGMQVEGYFKTGFQAAVVYYTHRVVSTYRNTAYRFTDGKPLIHLSFVSTASR